jgi:hypothetical protein
VYGLDALRRLRQRQKARADNPAGQLSLLEEAPPDAPMDDAVLTAWDGERFIAWEKWLATAPIEVEEPGIGTKETPPPANCLSADCGGTRVWLVRDGARWLMFVGDRRAGNRRKDFATPFVEHAIRTAEAWYGVPARGWRRQEKRDEPREADGDQN